MALKKRRSTAPPPPPPPAAESRSKAATLDARKSQADLHAQLNDRLTTQISRSGEGARLEMLALAKIEPDPDNQRTWYINHGTITILSQAFQQVWEEGAKTVSLPDEVLARSLDQIGRYASAMNVALPPLADVTETVRSIWDFAVHLKTEPLLQPFAVALGPGGKYQVVFGNRRFMASYIAHGDTHELECLRYKATPDFPAAKRFVENNQREDLPLQAKLEDFKRAVAEIRRGTDGRISNVEVANKLGVGRNLVQKLEKIGSCSDVQLLTGTGQVRTVEFAYKLAVLEGTDKSLFRAACKAIAEQGEPSGDFNTFKAALATQQPKKPDKRAAGRPAKIKIPPVGEPRVIQKLFAPTVLEKPEWRAIDWSDTGKGNIERIEKLIRKTLDSLVRELG